MQKQTMDYMQARIASESKMTVVHSFTVQKIGKDGVVLEQKIESAEIKHSSDPKTFDALADVLKDSAFTITLDATGKITKHEGYGALLKKFGKLIESGT